MKPDSTDTAANGPATPPPVWRGLDELAGEPGFREAMADEFPDGAGEFTDEVSRRRFLTLMGASLALAGAAGCGLRPAPQRKILPYTTQPDEITPGVPLFFATAAPLGGYGAGVLVRSHEGRPVKVEGNPDHPSSLGGAGVHALASVLDLYDPDRSRTPTRTGLPTSYDVASAALRARLDALRAKKGAGLRILTDTVTSPTLAAQIGKLLGDAEFPNARWVQFDPAGGDNVREGARKAFGKPLAAVYDFTKADVVLSLDSDFLCSGPGQVRYSRDFASRRKVRRDSHDGGKPEQMNRLYAVECMPTNTGATADHRLALTSGLIESFARALAGALGVGGVPAAGELPEAAKAWVKPLADDLNAKKGKAVVVVGDHCSASLQALGHAINAHLGAVGQTVRLIEPVAVRADEGRMSDLKTLVGELAAKQVDTLLVLGGSNPAYSAPADIDFAGVFRRNAEEKAQLSRKAARSGRDSLTEEEKRSLDYLNNFFSFHLGTHQDETAVLCEWHVPEAHYLEAWGDIRGHDGTAAIQQPLIAPLHGGKSAIELLADATSAPAREGLEIVRATWRGWFNGQKRSDAFEAFWQQSVRKGVIDGTASGPVSAAPAGNWSSDAPPAAAPPGRNDYEINFRPDPTLHDGRFANNGWLQELPKPLTKISWDNAAFVSPDTASKLDLKSNARWTGGEHGRMEVDVLELKVTVAGTERKVKAPVWILPGHADNAITLHLGHGRDPIQGRVAKSPDEPNADGKPVHGFNAYTIRTSDAPWATFAPKATRTGEKYYLACTQANWSMTEKDLFSGKDLDRKPVRRGTLDDYAKVPEFAKIPPMAVRDTDLINENIPQPRRHEKKDEKHNGKHDGHDDHGHDDHGHHDSRLIPLNMYHPAENLSPELNDAQRRRWAMAVDLSACTGCSACMVACQGENNIPVVGKNQVTKGREMYWINVDRYYEGLPGDAEALRTYFQPRMCVQCENAPCEIVCPVGATVHSTDGLNDMTYNRCVGTRYCSNNCPYKVRRFNFLTFQDWDTDTYKLGRNPDVSVRSRGVMEKCTFCVQRIRGAEIVAEREGRPIRDGEIVTACQAACPSGAIVFGDINDPDAVVSRWKHEPTNYGLLAELNTRPRLTYLAALRNPNPAMPKK